MTLCSIYALYLTALVDLCQALGVEVSGGDASVFRFCYNPTMPCHPLAGELLIQRAYIHTDPPPKVLAMMTES